MRRYWIQEHGSKPVDLHGNTDLYTRYAARCGKILKGKPEEWDPKDGSFSGWAYGMEVDGWIEEVGESSDNSAAA